MTCVVCASSYQPSKRRGPVSKYCSDRCSYRQWKRNRMKASPEQIRVERRRHYLKHSSSEIARVARWQASNPDRVSAYKRLFVGRYSTDAAFREMWRDRSWLAKTRATHGSDPVLLELLALRRAFNSAHGAGRPFKYGS